MAKVPYEDLYALIEPVKHGLFKVHGRHNEEGHEDKMISLLEGKAIYLLNESKIARSIVIDLLARDRPVPLLGMEAFGADNEGVVFSETSGALIEAAIDSLTIRGLLAHLYMDCGQPPSYCFNSERVVERLENGYHINYFKKNTLLRDVLKGILEPFKNECVPSHFQYDDRFF